MGDRNSRGERLHDSKDTIDESFFEDYLLVEEMRNSLDFICTKQVRGMVNDKWLKKVKSKQRIQNETSAQWIGYRGNN